MKHSAADILNILDDAARNFVFPMLDNGYVYPAAARLNLFRSPDNWALVFETFGFSPRAGLPNLLVNTFTSVPVRITTAADFVSADAFGNYINLHQHDDQVFYYPIEDDDWIDPDDGELVRSDAHVLSLRGQSVSLPSARDYVDATVVCQNESQPLVFELCRVLAFLKRGDVLATPTERTANLLPDLKCILTVEDWHHPDVVDSDILPSQSATFRQFAEVLISGDLSVYDPQQPGNTHWSNWPEGGSL